MELDGRTLVTTFSTGESTSGLPTDVTRGLYGFDEHSTDIEIIAGRDGGAVSSYRAMALSAPRLKVVNAKIMSDGTREPTTYFHNVEIGAA